MNKNNNISKEILATHITNLFSEHMPFNQLLGLQIKSLGEDKVEIRFPWHDKLMGNPIAKILHGGVTAAVLDNLPNVGTIDMRVDYLRPGKGKEFIATAEVIRKGKKVAVCRMELHNEEGTHIAFGTGTYMVG
jgi:uncharacterized protein (TIGR00369 family)